jgi:uncharacterized protein YndB with AHSA1/START domain
LVGPCRPSRDACGDGRSGGRRRHRLTSTETGGELWHGGFFREVAPPERLVFTFAWEEEGERGLETLVTVTFLEEGGRTRMTFRQVPFQSVEERRASRRLDEHLRSPRAASGQGQIAVR